MTTFRVVDEDGDYYETDGDPAVRFEEMRAERDELRARLDTIGLLLPVLANTVNAPRRDARSAELIVKAIAIHQAGSVPASKDGD